ILVGHMRQDLVHVQHGTYSHGRPRQGDKDERPIKISHLAEDNIRTTVKDVADRNSAFVAVKTDSLAHPVRNTAADEQADSSRSPHHADAFGTAIEHDLTEHAEQDLRGAAASGPAHANQSDAEDQRRRTHVAQTLGVFVPGTHYFGFRESL